MKKKSVKGNLKYFPKVRTLLELALLEILRERVWKVKILNVL